MRNLFTLCLACLLSSALSAQFGIMPALNLHEFSTTLPAGLDGQLTDLDTGYEMAIHYWFRLDKKRVEFQPTLYYAATTANSFFSRFTEVGVQYKVNIYPFDFGTDCNCPTFGKQGPQLQKGFFVQVAPGYSFTSIQLADAVLRRANGFTLGGGVGLDFGLSNLVTLTPMAAARYHTADQLSEMQFTNAQGEIIDAKTSLLTFQLGLQLTFRLDERRY